MGALKTTMNYRTRTAICPVNLISASASIGDDGTLGLDFGRPA